MKQVERQARNDRCAPDRIFPLPRAEAGPVARNVSVSVTRQKLE
jgi:hypothetical protein